MISFLVIVISLEVPVKQPNRKAREALERAADVAWSALQIVACAGLALSAIAAIASFPAALLGSPALAAALFLWAALVAAVSAAMAMLLDLFV